MSLAFVLAACVLGSPALPGGAQQANTEAASPGVARGASFAHRELAEPSQAPLPSVTWLALQLIPSPELVIGQEGVRPGLRWQVTPLLYSFGIHRSQSPWRALLAEPIVRHSGSLELYVSPQYVFGAAGGLYGRAGVRAYFPLLHRGEYLSTAIGSAYVRGLGEEAASAEVGVFALSGFVGLLLSYAPAFDPAQLSLILAVRVF